MKTFKQATTDLLAALTGMGWTVKAGLKIPHATSPDGLTRLWFKPQAVYAGRGSDFGAARSITSDLRTVTAEWLAAKGADHAAFLAAN
jgi:hypothetical protein